MVEWEIVNVITSSCNFYLLYSFSSIKYITVLFLNRSNSSRSQIQIRLPSLPYPRKSLREKIPKIVYFFCFQTPKPNPDFPALSSCFSLKECSISCSNPFANVLQFHEAHPLFALSSQLFSLLLFCWLRFSFFFLLLFPEEFLYYPLAYLPLVVSLSFPFLRLVRAFGFLVFDS